MKWLSSPKVRLALIVNGLYFISFFVTPSPPHARPHLFARPDGESLVRRSSKRSSSFTTLPPVSEASKAAAIVLNDFDQLDIYLKDDLTLMKSPGRRLLLSPALTTRASNPVAPNSVLMRFVSFSSEEVYSPESPVTITADGEYVLEGSAGSYGGGNATRSYNDRGTPEFVDTVGVNLPYEAFVEIISARRVVIQLGPDRVELTAEQVEALRDMRRRLP